MTRLHHCLLLGIALLVGACSEDRSAAKFSVKVESDPQRVVVVPVNRAATKVMSDLAYDTPNGGLSVRVVESESAVDEGSPVFGKFTLAERALEFTPTVPLAPDTLYRITFLPGRDGVSSVISHHRTASLTDSPRVLQVYPDSDVVPSNHLKFYIRFSSPMTQGDAYRHLSLLHADGSAVAGAFREVELWDPSGDVITVWLHPGRQKTGVNLNEDEGPVLKEGQHYILRVAAEWTALTGQKLDKITDHPFHVGAADHRQPVPSTWKITPSLHDKTVCVDFDEPLDLSPAAESIKERIWLTAKDGVACKTLTTIHRQGLVMAMSDLQSGGYVLHVRTDIEDLAGNSIARPFESATDAPQKKIAEVMELPFEVR